MMETRIQFIVSQQLDSVKWRLTDAEHTCLTEGQMCLGGVVGLITATDALEAVMGEIEDPIDRQLEDRERLGSDHESGDSEPR